MGGSFYVCILILRVLLYGFNIQVSVQQGPPFTLTCIGEGPCEMTEGGYVEFSGMVFREGTVFFTQPKHAFGGDSQLVGALPGQDYVPENVDPNFYTFMKVDSIDDCGFETDEVFYTIMDYLPGEFRIDIPVTIHDNDDNFHFEQDHYDVLETNGTLNFKVCRNGIKAATTGNTVEFATLAKTAESNKDFIPVTNQGIVFSLGATCESASVDIIPDPDTEEDVEVFEMNLYYNEPSSSGCTGKIDHPARAVVAIHDVTSSLFSIEFCEYSITESETGTSMFTFNIKRIGNTLPQSTIEVYTRAVSATENMDYEASTPTSVTFPPSSTNAEASIVIRSDEEKEESETFEVSIANPNSGIVKEPRKATVTIHDISTTQCCVRFESSVHVVKESRSATLTIKREGYLQKSGTVAVKLEDVDAVISSDYLLPDIITVEFVSGQEFANIVIPIVDDNIQEDTECFTVTLTQEGVPSNPMDICIPEIVNVMVKDDDDRFIFEGNFFKVLEDTGTLEVNIIRTGYLGKTSSVGITTTETGQSNSLDNGDFNLVDNQIMFDVNERSKVATLTLTTNDQAEGEEELFLELSSTSEVGFPRKATVVVYDINTCSPDCANGGTCIADNVCRCPPSYDGPTCQTLVGTVDGTFTIVEDPPGVPIVFTDDLFDPTSPRFQEMARTIEEQLSQAFIGIPGFIAVVILSFYPGSVGVRYAVKFDASVSADMNEVSRNFMEVVDDSAILGDTTFKLGETDIVCPVDYCLNGGQCFTTAINFYCRCINGFYGNQCENRVPTIPTASSVENTEGITDGGIIAIIFGIVALLLLVALLFLLLACVLRRHRRLRAKIQQPIPGQQMELMPYNGPNLGYMGVTGVSPLY